MAPLWVRRTVLLVLVANALDVGAATKRHLSLLPGDWRVLQYGLVALLGVWMVRTLADPDSGLIRGLRQVLTLPIPRPALIAVLVALAVQVTTITLAATVYPFTEVGMFRHLAGPSRKGRVRSRHFVARQGGDWEELSLKREGDRIFARHMRAHWDNHTGTLSYLRRLKKRKRRDWVRRELKKGGVRWMKRGAVVLDWNTLTVTPRPPLLSPGTQKKAKTDTQKKAKTDTQKKAKTDTQKKAKTDTQKKAKPDTQRKAKTDTQRKAKPDTQRKAKAGTKP